MATSAWYPSGGLALARGAIDWEYHSIKVILLMNYTYSESHETYADVKLWEISGSGYIPGGNPLAGRTLVYTSASRRVQLRAAKSSWILAPGNTIMASDAIVYKAEATDTNSPLISHIDFGVTQTITSAPFEIEWDISNGVTHLQLP